MYSQSEADLVRENRMLSEQLELAHRAQSGLSLDVRALSEQLADAQATVEALQREHSQLQALVRALDVPKSYVVSADDHGGQIRLPDGYILFTATSRSRTYALENILDYVRTLDATTPAHEPGCPAVCDDEGDQVLEDCGQCTCEAVRGKGGDGE